MEQKRSTPKIGNTRITNTYSFQIVHCQVQLSTITGIFMFYIQLVL